MAIKKKITIDVDARQAISEMEELGSSFEDVFGEVQPLSTKIGEMEDALYRMAEAGDTSSKEFKDLSESVGKMKKVIIDTDMAVDGMSQTLTQNVGGALQGVASGFELAQGAMGTFGAGGEAVEEALLKVQSAMAISQGLQGIRESIASFKALRAAVMSNVVVQKLLNFVMNLNPIGMIILGVAALGAAIALLYSPIKKLLQFMGLVADDTETAAEATKRLTAEIEKQEKAVERLEAKHSKMHDNRMRDLKLRGASEEEIHQAELDNLAKIEADRVASLISSKGRINKLTAAYKQAKKEEDFESARSLKEQIEQQKETIRQAKLNHGEYNRAKQESDKEYLENQAAEEADALKERQDRYKTFLDERQAAERRIEDLKNGLIEDDLDREIAIRREQYKRELEDIKAKGEQKKEIEKLLALELAKDLAEIQKTSDDKQKETDKALADFKKDADEKYLDDKEALQETIYQESLSKDEAEIEAVTSKYFNLITLAEQYGLDTVALKEKEAAELELIATASADKQKALDKDVRDSKVAIAQNGLQLVSDLAGMFANRSEKAARIAFNVQKAASIAQATISGIEATINAFKTASASPVTIGFPAFPFIQAGLAGAFAAANIAKIASSKFGGTGGVGSVSAPSGVGSTGGGGSNTAQFNVVGNTGVNQLAESLGGQENVTKTYVVASDVTTAQSLDRNKVSTATL